MLNHNRLRIGTAVALALTIFVHGLSAAVLEDNFDDGTLADFPSPNVVGATLVNPGSGGNPDGYLQASREVGNTGYALSEKYTGDWEALVGASGIVLSVDFRIEDAGQVTTLRLDISNPTFSDLWRRDIFMGSPFPWDSNDGWVTFNYPIDLNWTDEEANDNGWHRVFPSGSPKSFSEVLHDVKGPLTYFVLAGDPNVAPHSFLTGMDNFRIAPAVSAVPGDFDGDGDVDGADFVAWQTNFPKASGAVLEEGDADGDGDVDGADFVVWQTNFPFTPGQGASPVPEPNSLLLIAIVSTLIIRSQRKQPHLQVRR